MFLKFIIVIIYFNAKCIYCEYHISFKNYIFYFNSKWHCGINKPVFLEVVSKTISFTQSQQFHCLSNLWVAHPISDPASPLPHLAGSGGEPNNLKPVSSPKNLYYT